jgi:hypothetical protein
MHVIGKGYFDHGNGFNNPVFSDHVIIWMIYHNLGRALMLPPPAGPADPTVIYALLQISLALGCTLVIQWFWFQRERKEWVKALADLDSEWKRNIELLKQKHQQDLETIQKAMQARQSHPRPDIIN